MALQLEHIPESGTSLALPLFLWRGRSDTERRKQRWPGGEQGAGRECLSGSGPLPIFQPM